MNTTQVVLPDGRLLVIEGADARQTAAIINNEFTRNVPALSESGETPLEIAALNFSRAPLQAIFPTEEETPPVMPAVI
jgi:hypothetical protein